MAGVILVLGLIAAGIYTGNVAFYWVAGVLGIFWFFFMIITLSIAASVKSQMNKMDDKWFGGNAGKVRRGR